VVFGLLSLGYDLTINLVLLVAKATIFVAAATANHFARIELWQATGAMVSVEALLGLALSAMVGMGTVTVGAVGLFTDNKQQHVHEVTLFWPKGQPRSRATPLAASTHPRWLAGMRNSHTIYHFRDRLGRIWLCAQPKGFQSPQKLPSLARSKRLTLAIGNSSPPMGAIGVTSAPCRASMP